MLVYRRVTDVISSPSQRDPFSKLGFNQLVIPDSLQGLFIHAPIGYGSIPINTIFRGMNIHLPAILITRGTRFWHTANWFLGENDGYWGMVGEATDGMVIEYDVESHSSSTSAGGDGAVPEGGFTHPYTKLLGDPEQRMVWPPGFAGSASYRFLTWHIFLVLYIYI